MKMMYLRIWKDRKIKVDKMISLSCIKDGNKYVHSFHSGTVLEMPLTKDGKYTKCILIQVITNKTCKLRLYTIVAGTVVWAWNSHGFAKTNLIEGKVNAVTTCNKYISIVTNKKCVLQVKINPITSSFKPKHVNLPICRLSECARIKLNQTNYPPCNVKDIQYFLMANKAITITDHIISELKYPPYSVRINPSKGCKLHYRIRMKLSAGDKANVTVSCIESGMGGSYILLDGLVNYSKGTICEGFFNVPAGYTDVGLLISTPYGFSGDFGDDVTKDCIVFESFLCE